MNEQAKQKILLGVLAILILGAGSFWFLGRESSSSSNDYSPGPARRRQRVQVDEVKNTRKPVRSKRTEAEATKRRERQETAKSQPSRKRGRRGNTDKVKKKKIAPAA
jgi:hypothetical protein